MTWLVAILFVGILVLGAALWDEWREHHEWTHAGLGDDPAHTQACPICDRRSGRTS